MIEVSRPIRERTAIFESQSLGPLTELPYFFEFSLQIFFILSKKYNKSNYEIKKYTILEGFRKNKCTEYAHFGWTSLYGCNGKGVKEILKKKIDLQ